MENSKLFDFQHSRVIVEIDGIPGSSYPMRVVRKLSDWSSPDVSIELEEGQLDALRCLSWRAVLSEDDSSHKTAILRRVLRVLSKQVPYSDEEQRAVNEIERLRAEALSSRARPVSGPG